MTKTRWRIYTEYVHTRHIAKIVSKYFNDYSMFSGIGHYKGEHERCLVIEIIVGVTDVCFDGGEGAVIAICREINSDNHQKCCMVTSELVEVMIVADKKQPA